LKIPGHWFTNSEQQQNPDLLPSTVGRKDLHGRNYPVGW
jgi:hypothetical protein